MPDNLYLKARYDDGKCMRIKCLDRRTVKVPPIFRVQNHLLVRKLEMCLVDEVVLVSTLDPEPLHYLIPYAGLIEFYIPSHLFDEHDRNTLDSLRPEWNKEPKFI